MTDNWGEPIKGTEREYWNGKDSPAKIGDERIGEILRIEAGFYKEKPTTNYVIELEDGRECWLPNHVLLNSALMKVKTGQRIKVVYKGSGEKRGKGKNPAEKYDVYVSDAPRQTGLTEKPKEDFPQAPETMPQKTARFLAGIGKIGIHDSRILDTMTEIFGDRDKAEFVFGMLKQSGQITQKPDGCWVKT